MPSGFKNQPIALLALLLLLFNLTVAPLSASRTLSAAQTYAGDDKVLICTGRDMKWVDMAASLSRGQFVFVDPPEQLPEPLQQVKCSAGLLLDNSTIMAGNAALIPSQKITLAAFSLFSSAPLNDRYNKALSRAPPFIFRLFQ
ncbi:hypothetical protein [Lacimicrobium alkaliphilum]|uniref:Uncharacterized protein n=1 Tax=Lacimicrobium alkaliphilum TaxID=1526571 RepID=A0ABQ1R1R1_9ALTE|nr:hypothetical protein [Lacimicrobium alkaliphilum]GGD55126.1 hypothetical protein GCM10011357_08520 [Lacimicrobium alkaliphilum]